MFLICILFLNVFLLLCTYIFKVAQGDMLPEMAADPGNNTVTSPAKLEGSCRCFFAPALVLWVKLTVKYPCVHLTSTSSPVKTFSLERNETLFSFSFSSIQIHLFLDQPDMFISLFHAAPNSTIPPFYTLPPFPFCSCHVRCLLSTAAPDVPECPFKGSSDVVDRLVAQPTVVAIFFSLATSSSIHKNEGWNTFCKSQTRIALLSRKFSVHNLLVMYRVKLVAVKPAVERKRGNILWLWSKKIRVALPDSGHRGWRDRLT